MNLNHLWKNYSLSTVLFIFFIISWAAHAFTQWGVYTSEAKQHNQPVEVGEFVTEFAASTFENWQSEFLQLFTMVVLTSFLVHKGCPESKDTQDQTDAALARIERKVEALSKRK